MKTQANTMIRDIKVTNENRWSIPCRFADLIDMVVVNANVAEENVDARLDYIVDALRAERPADVTIYRGGNHVAVIGSDGERAVLIAAVECGFANHIGYSDVTPYEIIRVVSPRCIEVREMDAKLADGQKPEIIPGGFSGHCTNQRELKYDITSNESNRVVRLRFGKKGWKAATGERFAVDAAPIRFYDYNF